MRLTVMGPLFIKSLSLSTAFSSYVYINYVWFNVFPTILDLNVISFNHYTNIPGLNYLFYISIISLNTLPKLSLITKSALESLIVIVLLINTSLSPL